MRKISVSERAPEERALKENVSPFFAVMEREKAGRITQRASGLEPLAQK